MDGCPLYTEYFKDGDDVPDRLCTLHRGTIRQRVTRTVQGWASEVGRRSATSSADRFAPGSSKELPYIIV